MTHLDIKSRPTWDEVWMDAAHNIARRSLCDRSEVGCVIVAEDQTVLSMSYNGPPPGFSTRGQGCSSWCPRGAGEVALDTTYGTCPSAHAEQNGIARLDRSRVRGATAYITRTPCPNCAKLLAASGIARVVFPVLEKDSHLDPDDTQTYLRKCGVIVQEWHIA